MKKWDVLNLTLSSYKNITNTIPSGIIVTDTNGWIKFANHVARGILGNEFGRKRKVSKALLVTPGTTREMLITVPGKNKRFLEVT